MFSCVLVSVLLAAGPFEQTIPLAYMRLETDGDEKVTATLIAGTEGKIRRFYGDGGTKVEINNKQATLFDLFEEVRKARINTLEAKITTKNKDSSVALFISVQTKKKP